MSLIDMSYFQGKGDDHDADAEAKRLLGANIHRIPPQEEFLCRRAHPLQDIISGRKLILEISLKAFF